MADLTRRIGLSLGADICWPICYEDIVGELDLALPMGGDTVHFEVKRLDIEPFDLRQPAKQDVVLDRLTHWYHPTREWIKKAVLMDGLYVLNNPWSVQSMEKHTSYCAMMHLGMPVPDTALLPPKDYDDLPDLEPTLAQYAKLFDLNQVGDRIGYPSFLKPYDGGGWVGVSKIDDAEELGTAYDESGKRVMHLQKGIVPYDCFVRCVGLGPQVRTVRYDPDRPLHERYRPDRGFLPAKDIAVLEDITLTINAFFGWDFNSCESLRQDGTWHPIDFANPCPDSQVTSLHAHFPWLIKAKIRWSLFCAATGRKMKRNLDWQPYFDVREQGMPFPDALKAYGALAREHFQADAFEEFCATHLAHLDEVAHEYFGSNRAREAVAKKVRALYPEDEWEEFTELFWQSVLAGREE